jgi:glycosyltransferase involved in cell wall biosynthesis
VTNVKAIPTADVNVYNKHFDQKDALMGVQRGADHGFYSVFDICDDHFDRENGPFYEAMCKLSDALTCNSANMQERIYEVTGKLARIIPDPITFPKRDFKDVHVDTPNILWFGHKSNLPALIPWIDALPEGMEITVITNTAFAYPKVKAYKWKPQLVEKLIAGYDIVVLPSHAGYDIVVLPSQTDEWAKCKSPNRAVDAIQSGCYVVTDSKDIYGDLEMFVDIIKSPEELPEVIEYWKTHQTQIKERVEKGQEFIAEAYNDDVIIDGWLNVLKDLEVVEEFKND